jgi:hypothetical protein
MIFCQSISTREIDSLNLIFIDFDVLALTATSSDARPRCKFLIIQPYLQSVAYIQASSTKRARYVPGVWGASLMYKLYNIGDRTEACGTAACIFLGVDSSPSTETWNFLLERKELISLTVLAEKFNLSNLCDKPG